MTALFWPDAPALSERTRLRPLEPTGLEVPSRDQQDLMQHPFFSLAKAKRIAPILYRAGEVEVQVHALPEHGMASIWDADLLIWAGSQIVEAADRNRATSRFVRFRPYQFLTAVGRGTGQRHYSLLKGSLQRLQSTVIVTTVRNGANWRRAQFSWVNEWEERLDRRGRSQGVELVLPEWFYRGVLDRSLVLTIDPAYFQLTGGIERWLYRVARKHAGRQLQGWRFEMRHLHLKSGSQARFSDFALDVRRIAARQSLPGYRLIVTSEAGRDLVLITPMPTMAACGKHVKVFGTSGAGGHGTSGAQYIDSNRDSNSVGRSRCEQPLLPFEPSVQRDRFGKGGAR